MKKQFWITMGLLLLGGMLMSAAEDVPYEVVKTAGAIEIRQYPATVTAEVLVAGNRKDAASTAFGLLVAFIRGNNVGEQSIPMTAPVAQVQTSPNKWRVSFYMPATMAPEAVPQPLDDRVTLKMHPPRTVAAIRFAGRWQQPNLDKHDTHLRRFLVAEAYGAADRSTYAFYNAPFTPWFLRRNEVWVELISR